LLWRSITLLRSIILVVAGTIFFLVLGYFVLGVSRRRNEDAGAGKLSDPVHAILALSG
jgi:hypothetical protein